MHSKTILVSLFVSLLAQTGAARVHGHNRRQYDRIHSWARESSSVTAIATTSGAAATTVVATTVQTTLATSVVTTAASSSAAKVSTTTTTTPPAAASSTVASSSSAASALPTAGSDVGVSGYSSSDPVITIINKGTTDRTFNVETSSSCPPSVYQGGHFTVGAGQTTNFHPGASWIGAISDKAGKGTRFEPNFGSAGVTWYDADMEIGMSDAVIAPVDGSGPLAGEKDTLSTANAVWSSVDSATKSTLLSSGYIFGSTNSLTSVYMDTGAKKTAAGATAINFLQVTAKFNAYVTCGSVGGTDVMVLNGVDLTKANQIADTMSKRATSQHMVLTVY
ncbi:hypothetical protein B0A49_12491 [Cryomyces minteri]|uniref:Peptidase A1 domain-containing protein n=1 Tax=Cryomyces minteri TaxID=331657 RepID=A0A4U0W948_9PEZI|nr:hypothetical protein B0A49_12491 [Cryomyces minteri]